MKITAEENRNTRAKVTSKCTVYNEPKSPGDVVTVDQFTFRNMERKKLLEKTK